MNQQPRRDIRTPGHSHSDSPIRKLLLIFFANWYYFGISLVLLLAIAYFFVKYNFPTYLTSTAVLIEESSHSGAPGIENSLLEGFTVRPGAQNLDNQILILSSYTLIEEALDELPFETDIFRKSIFNSVSYYPLDPIRVEYRQDSPLPYNSVFILQYEENGKYNLRTSKKSSVRMDTTIVLGQLVRWGKGTFVIHPNREFEDIYKSGMEIYFRFNSKESLVESYKRRLEVSAASREGSIVQVSLEGTNKIKDAVFLNMLTQVFIMNNLEKKNHEANRIIEFIDNQLVDVSDSLTITETQLQEFRSRNRIMDVSAQAQHIIDQAVALENEKARLKLEADYYDYLDNYLAADDNEEVPISPATMGIADPLLGSLMQEFSALQAEYFSSGVGEMNPLQAQLELRIKNTKQSLRETLQGIKLANQMAIDENTSQINRMNAQASRLPVKERQLLGFERKFNLNNVLYTFLLQRRAEAQIQKASNQPDNEVVDPARTGIHPVAPNIQAIFFIALILGIGIPYSVIYIGELVRNKISSEEDLQNLSPLPVVGHIPHSRLSYNTVVLNEPNSRISEAFRSLRTRMEFLTKEAKSPMILVSSSMPGEGKTFNAINLASAYSLAGKKTVLLEFDLRKPTISKSFGMNGEKGLTTFLIGKNSLNEIIFNSGHKNLDIIPCGPIPPNPGELTSSEKAVSMFNELRKKYEFIVVDTAPIGTVSDNYKIADIADAILLMVRHSHTDKRVLEATLRDVQESGISQLSLIVNGIKSKGSSYRYSYNYRYEYKNSRTRRFKLPSRK